MGISSIGSTPVTTGMGQGTSGFVSAASTVAGTSPPNAASVPNTSLSTQTPTSTQIKQAVKQVNDNFSQNNQNMYATLGIDKATGIEVVKIIDKDNNQVISQYPSKAILAVAQSLEQQQGSGGQLLNTTA
jgi:uncharacterized FlaG/YvyC family protein